MWRYQFVTNAKLPLVEVWRYCDSLFISYSILCSWALWSMLTLTFDLFIWKLVNKLHVTYDNICKLCDNFGLFIAFYSSIKSRWRHNWKSAQVVNSHLVCDPTIRQPGFDLPRQQWSLLNSFLTEQGHCGACRRKWRLTDTDLCPFGETHTMFHIVKFCPLTKLNCGLSRLHSADEDTVSWLTSYASWHAYEKKKKDSWTNITDWEMHNVAF